MKPADPQARVQGAILLLCAMALASPLVETTPGNLGALFWTFRAAGVLAAVVALVWPRALSRGLVLVAFLLVVVPTCLQMFYRTYHGRHTFCHDSVIQFEEAIRMVRRGGNPYAEDFRGTPMERWQGAKDNPALHHFIYPPLLLLLSTPVEAACRALLFRLPPDAPERFYDQRIVLLMFFIGMLALLGRILRDHPQRAGITALVALNPWFSVFVVEGRNDAAMLFWVLAAWWAYGADRRRLGHLLLGLAIATKTLLLPMVPFVVYANRREWPACAALLLAPILLTSIPFLAADAPAFLEDVIGAPSGLGSNPFEMRGWSGYGFANLVLLLGLVGSPRAYFPFWIFQLAALGPVLWFGGKSLRADPSFANALLWSAGAVFVLLFFGRFIHDNYIGALLSLAVISHAARGTPPAAQSTPAAA